MVRRAGSLRSAALAAALVSGCLAACAPDPQQGIETAAPIVDVAPDRELAQRVPDGVAADGVLKIGTDPPYAPLEYFTADRRLTGLEVQLVMAVAAKLDLRPRFLPEAFTAVPAGVRAGRFEIGAAALSLRPDEALPTDAVVYLESAIRLVRPTGSQATLTDMCGRRIAALEGSQQLAALSEASKECVADGARPIAILSSLTQDDVTRAVLTRRAEAMVADAPVAQYAVQSSFGELQLAPGSIDPAPFLLLVAFGPELTYVVADAIDQLIAEGAYQDILAAFAIREGGLTQAVVLPAGDTLRGVEVPVAPGPG